MTGQAKHPKKKALTPKPGSRYYDEMMMEKEQERRGAKNAPAIGRRHIIKELPNIRTILFAGVEINFLPFCGTYWITRESIKQALGIDLGHVSIFLHENPDMCAILPDAEMVKAIRLPNESGECYYSAYAASVAIERSPLRNLPCPHELQAFIDLLKEMESVVCVHSHTLNGQWQRLRAQFNRNPHWEDILKLWNDGMSEGKISVLLSVKVTAVRSAILRCAEHGFEVLDADAKASRRSRPFSGNRIPIPDVRKG